MARWCGYTISEETKRKMSLAKLEDGNCKWKGDSVGYSQLHKWVKARMPKPTHCAMCQKPNDVLVLHNIWGTYRRIISEHEWVYLCYVCHIKVHKKD